MLLKNRYCIFSPLVRKPGNCIKHMIAFTPRIYPVSLATSTAVANINLFRLEKRNVYNVGKNLIEFFILKEEIESALKKQLLSDDELKLIDINRKEKAKSITVKFDKSQEITQIEVEKIKKSAGFTR